MNKPAILALIAAAILGGAYFYSKRAAERPTAEGPSDPGSAPREAPKTFGDAVLGGVGSLLGAAGEGVGAAIGKAAGEVLSADAIEDPDSALRRGTSNRADFLGDVGGVLTGRGLKASKQNDRHRQSSKNQNFRDGLRSQWESHAAEVASLLSREDVASWRIEQDGTAVVQFKQGGTFARALPPGLLGGDLQTAKALAVEPVVRTLGVVRQTGTGPLKGQPFRFHYKSSWSDANPYAPQNEKLSNVLAWEESPEGVAFHAEGLGRRVRGKRYERGLSALQAQGEVAA